MIRVNAIAERYAKALFQASLAQGLLSAVLADCQMLGGAFRTDANLARVLGGRVVPAAQFSAAFGALQKKLDLQPVTGRLMQVVAENGRQKLLPAIFLDFERKVRAHQGQKDAYVASAHPLTAAQRARLVAVLERRTNAAIILHEEIKPQLIGGMVVRVGSCEVDSSIHTQLTRMHQSLENLKE